jgi:hypothetical protein
VVLALGAVVCEAQRSNHARVRMRQATHRTAAAQPWHPSESPRHRRGMIGHRRFTEEDRMKNHPPAMRGASAGETPAEREGKMPSPQEAARRACVVAAHDAANNGTRRTRQAKTTDA